MRKIAIALALTCAPVVCLATDDDALINPLNGGIDEGIAALQAKLPLKFAPGMAITGVRRESRTIVYTMDFQLPSDGLVVAQSGGHSARVGPASAKTTERVGSTSAM
jgi:hypothetical protein